MVKYHPLACKLVDHVAHAWIVRRSVVQLQIHGSPLVAAFVPVASVGGINIPFRVHAITWILSIHEITNHHVMFHPVISMLFHLTEIVDPDIEDPHQIIHVRIL
jgi:hypothetical protein